MSQRHNVEEIFKIQKEETQPRILYQIKLSFKIEKEIIFQTHKHFKTPSPAD